MNLTRRHHFRHKGETKAQTAKEYVRTLKHHPAVHKLVANAAFISGQISAFQQANEERRAWDHVQELRDQGKRKEAAKLAKALGSLKW